MKAGDKRPVRTGCAILYARADIVPTETKIQKPPEGGLLQYLVTIA
jgi:hypothetical protein